jgi:two-component system, NarL family, nitrate/nitrite response regulator NarL
VTTSSRSVTAIIVEGGLAETFSSRCYRALISFHTVKFHVAAILEKLDADTRTEAVMKAARLGIVML